MLTQGVRLFGQSDAGPQVLADGRVTFRFVSTEAETVALNIEAGGRHQMERDAAGMWTCTVEGLEPDFYTYHFIVDGTPRHDPANSQRKHIVSGGHTSILHVPGPDSLPWERGDEPRGTVHTITYHSDSANEDRDLLIYTPPGYEGDGETKYPVLYLLHGVTDDARAWTTIGRADVILDNLIAAGLARPMIVVMPLGYGFSDPASNISRAVGPTVVQRTIMQTFAAMMNEEIIPLVELEFRVSAERESRAIAGLSMGGSQAMYIGLNHAERFGWIGSFSGAFVMYGGDSDSWFQGIGDPSSPRAPVIWRSVGTDDFLLPVNRRFGAWLEGKSIENTSVETTGGHAWGVFRRALIAFAPLLFVESE